MLTFKESASRAQARLDRHSARRRRSDAGRSRLAPDVLAALRVLVGGTDRPSMASVERDLKAWCQRHGRRPPARASLYNVLPGLDGHAYEVADLPAAVRHALYNLPPHGPIRGAQLAFYCFNYGTLPAVSFAAGLPWLDLYQAWTLRGWRPRSRGLLAAVLTMRGIR